MSQRTPVIPNGVLAMGIFIFTEVMLFSGFISAFSIFKAGSIVWPPPNQPKLPVEITAFNTLVLLISGVFLIIANINFRRNSMKEAKSYFVKSVLLATMFVMIQGFEWIRLINYGLTFKSSSYGSYFYLIIGGHALHVFIALLFMIIQIPSFNNGSIKKERFYTLQAFWYFVVGVWPFLYMVMYF
jgi:heme/copper-type cytochrome/quinol oxidase subunit 3